MMLSLTLICLMSILFPVDYSDKQKQRLVFKAQPYTMIGEVLYKKGKDEILRMY